MWFTTWRPLFLELHEQGLKNICHRIKKSQELDVEGNQEAIKLFLVDRLQILFNRDVIFWLQILDSVPLPYIWHVKKDIPVKLVF